MATPDSTQSDPMRPASMRPARPGMPAARTALLLSCLLLAALLAGCRRELPPTEQPPEPQAHTQLRDAIQEPLDKARGVEQTLQDAAEQQRKQVDAAEAD